MFEILFYLMGGWGGQGAISEKGGIVKSGGIIYKKEG